jgi:hypothetical protein
MPATDELAYVEVGADEVAPATHRAGEAARWHAAKALHLMRAHYEPYDPAAFDGLGPGELVHEPGFRLRWFRPATSTAADRGDLLMSDIAHLLYRADPNPETLPRWFAAARTFTTDEAVAGIARRREPDAVWVAAGLSPRSAALAVLHEARHRWQATAEGGLWRDNSAAENAVCEDDAAEWSQEQVDAVVPLHG